MEFVGASGNGSDEENPALRKKRENWSGVWVGDGEGKHGIGPEAPLLFYSNAPSYTI